MKFNSDDRKFFFWMQVPYSHFFSFSNNPIMKIHVFRLSWVVFAFRSLMLKVMHNYVTLSTFTSTNQLVCALLVQIFYTSIYLALFYNYCSHQGQYICGYIWTSLNLVGWANPWSYISSSRLSDCKPSTISSQ